MKIKIVRENYGYMLSGHVHLIAWCESGKDFYTPSKGKRIFAIKLDFYPKKGPSIEPVSRPHDNEDHNSVILNSEINFAAFCEELANSPFAHCDSFNWTKANCVDSIKFALEKANLSITFNKTRSCKHIINFFCCPSTFTPPREIIKTLKYWKKENQPDNIINQKMRVIEDMENKATRAEQIANIGTFGALPCLISGIGASIALMLLTETNLALPMAACMLVTSIGGASLYNSTGKIFNKKAIKKSKEIQEEYKHNTKKH